MTQWNIYVEHPNGSQLMNSLVGSKSKDAALDLALSVLKGSQVPYPSQGLKLVLRVVSP